MAEEALPSISTGQVGSRFVTEKEVVEARAKRDEAWQAAYARYKLTIIRSSHLPHQLF
jgi:hypothetical protein